MDIVICENEEKWRNKIKDNLLKYSIANDLDINMPLITSDSTKALEYIKHNPCDLLISGIYFEKPNISGINLIKQLRLNNLNTPVIFVSSRIDMILTLIKHAPFDFIYKPNFCKDFKNTIISVNNKYISNNFLKVKNKSFNLSNTMYIEKLSGKSIFHTLFSETYEYVSFSELLEKLNTDFIRIHKSYIVNKKFIEYMDYSKREVVLANKTILPIGDKYIKGTM